SSDLDDGLVPVPVTAVADLQLLGPGVRAVQTLERPGFVTPPRVQHDGYPLGLPPPFHPGSLHSPGRAGSTAGGAGLSPFRLYDRVVDDPLGDAVLLGDVRDGLLAGRSRLLPGAPPPTTVISPRPPSSAHAASSPSVPRRTSS